MRNKKSRKSMFNWCIRTLAVSLVPSILLTSCASDSGSGSGAPDTTAPTLTSTNPISNATIVGTAVYTLTFSETVTGLSGNTAAGACTGNVQLTSTGGNCLAIGLTSSNGTEWTVDPDGELSDGTYTLTVISAGITDGAGNALADNATVTFTIDDPVSTVLNNLDKALDDAGVGSLRENILTAARAVGDSLSDDKKRLARCNSSGL